MIKKMNAKISVLAFAVASLLLIASCQSTKNSVSSDSYSGKDSYDENFSETKEASAKSNSSNAKKDSFNFVDAFFGKKFADLDEFTLSTATATFGIKQKTAVFVYGLKNERYGFGSPYMAAYYYFTLDDTGRKTYIKAVNSYLKDFEEKKLDRKNNKTEKAYGFVNARVDWGTIKSSTPNNGEGAAYFGYSFKDKSPYFTISMRPVGNKKFLEGDEMADKESLLLHYYFTKAQAKQLAEFLSDENIASLQFNSIKETEADVDDY